MKTQKLFSRVLDGLIVLFFILFFASAGFQDRSTSGWYQQFFPNMNGSTIQSMTFLDSLTGFAVTNANSNLQSYILKTTNGGDNWFFNYTYTPPYTNWKFVKIVFINLNTGYAFTDDVETFTTTNSGLNWNILNTGMYPEDAAVLNKDTILIVKSNGLNGGVYRSTNGGINWQYIWNNSPNGNPSKIYMYDKNLGFTQDGSNYMRRTTNGGFNWTIVNGEFFSGIEFKDSLIGWKTYGGIQKTTNGGLNWFVQQLPNISSSYINSNLDIVSNDTVWMVGARKFGKPPVYKTTNGGTNWGYQYPDTTLQIYSFSFIQFVNAKVGWIYPASPTSLLHTINGGQDTTFFTGIKLVPDIVPEKFSLGQNYPNPFNPATNIPFELKEPSHVTLKVFDARGREVKELVNGRWGTGKFIADFDASALATGIYFYQIIVSGETTHQTFTETRKMMVLK